VIQRVLADSRSRKLKEIEPVSLDHIDGQAVVGIDIQRQQDLVVFDGQRLREKAAKEHDHIRV
jgi:hypothetical protein